MTKEEWTGSVLKRDNKRCCRCNKETTNVISIYFGEKEYEICNGLTMCKECVEKYREAFGGKSDWHSWEKFVNEEGRTLRRPIIIEKKALTTEDIIKSMSKRNDISLSQQELKTVINAFKEEVAAALTEEKRVQITGLFTVEPMYRRERMANDISTGNPLKLEASVGVSIKAGTILKLAAGMLDPEDFKLDTK